MASQLQQTSQADATTLAFDINKNRRRVLQFMQQTHETLLHVLAPVSQETATTLRDARDGDRGWTVLEVLCHLRDFDAIFRRRAHLISTQEYPHLPPQDHERLAVQGDYNAQNLAAVMEEFTESRRQTVRFFEELDNDLWPRAGVHPERGHYTMLDAALQIGMHDTIHLEQITRILYQNV